VINSPIVLPAFLRALALGIFLLFLATAVPPAILQSGGRVLWAASLAKEDEETARRRFLGEPWARSIDEIRQVIPPDGEYLLASAEGTEDTYWIRFELAPRRALFLGRWSQLPAGALLPPGPRWVVVAFEEPRPPLLMTREAFLRRIDRSRGGS
jgi:hypothetical protein